MGPVSGGGGFAATVASMARRDSDQLTALRRTRYLGSHPSAAGQVDDVDIIFTRHEIRLRPRRKRETERIVPWADVIALTADSYEHVEQHLRTLDVLLLGPLALFSRDRTVHSFLILTDVKGEWIFAVPKLSHVELRAGLGPLQQLVPSEPLPIADGAMADQPVGPQDEQQTPDPSRLNPADRLREVTKLHRAGILSTEEYEMKRSQLIEEL